MQAGALYATSGSKWHRFVKTRVKSLPLGKPKPKIAFNPFNSRPSHVSGGIEYLPCSAFRDSTYLGWPSNVVIHACPPTRIESRRPPTTTTIPSHDRPQTYRTPHPTDTSSRTPPAELPDLLDFQHHRSEIEMLFGDSEPVPRSSSRLARLFGSRDKGKKPRGAYFGRGARRGRATGAWDRVAEVDTAMVMRGRKR